MIAAACSGHTFSMNRHCRSRPTGRARFAWSSTVIPAIAALRGHTLDIRYRLDGSAVVFACDGFSVDGDLLDIPFEAWKRWSHLQLLLRPDLDAPRAELVVGDMRGRYLRSTDGRPRAVHARGLLTQRLDFADGARGMTFRVDARAGGALGHLRVFMGLTAHASLSALGPPTLRPPPARLPAQPGRAAVIHSAP